jgi:hypothetical protein
MLLKIGSSAGQQLQVNHSASRVLPMVALEEIASLLQLLFVLHNPTVAALQLRSAG